MLAYGTHTFDHEPFVWFVVRFVLSVWALVPLPSGYTSWAKYGKPRDESTPAES